MRLTKSQAGFMVLLRLACGSHFFYQGMIKLVDRSWSCYSYLINSEGILAGVFRWMAETEAVLAFVDMANIWGLILIGLALILGVFGRIACLCGFILLSVYYMANPPFQIMGSSGAGGEYSFIVNKLLIEMVAFLVLFLFPTDSIFGLGKIKELFFRKRTGGEEAAKKLSRREILSTVGSLPVLGVFSYPFLKGGLRKKLDAISGATAAAVTDSYKKEYARLKTMDLNEPGIVAKQKNMPVGQIGGLSMGRLISGSNLISMNMHARDLDYVRSLATNYNTEERIFMTLKKCEEYGINAIVLKDHNFEQFRLSRYWDEWGGEMLWIADVITTDIE
ncbi:MAG: DoxX family membrane protein [Planctomycetota bacterium]|jgi:thiosulfate dehydrogenase [quinone] large subunit